MALEEIEGVAILEVAIPVEVLVHIKVAATEGLGFQVEFLNLTYHV